MAALMLATGVVVTTPPVVAQQETVPTKSTVAFEPIPNLRQFLYATFDTVGVAANPQPDCVNAQSRRLNLTPAVEPTAAGGRASCAFQASVSTAPTAGGVEFQLWQDMWPNRRVTLTGNTSFAYHHEGAVPTGVEIDVSVRSDAQVIATGRLVGTGGAVYNVPLTLAGPTANTGRVFLEANRSVTLALAARAVEDTSTLPQPIPGTAPTWALDDTNTYIEIRADDAIRAAAWITDEKDELKSIFAPIANDSLRPEDQDRRIVGHFALQSVFGPKDAAGPASAPGRAPRFSLLRDSATVEIGVGGQTVLEGAENKSASVTSLGIVVWSFPAGTVDYRGFRSGQYTMHVEATHHQGSPINRASDRLFSITSQTVRLDPYSDPRIAGLVETQAHAVSPGSSTTYVLSVNNTGAVDDNFTINLTAPNAPSGWGATVGGPDVLARRLFVPAGETRVFTVTVNAPFTATGDVIHLVNVTSVLDPGARSRDLILSTSVRPDVVREVGVIFLERDTSLAPGLQHTFPVYVWNRGTRVANVSLEIRETQIAGWTIDLASGSANVDRVVLSSIQPGDLAEATLRVTGPVSAAVPSHGITLNATHLDVAGVTGDRSITFTLRSVIGVQLTTVPVAGGRDHRAEVEGQIIATQTVDGSEQLAANPACITGCDADGVDGIWHRVWVTNTGRVTDSFDLTADSFVSNCIAPSPSRSVQPPVLPNGPMNDTFNFYTRSPSGAVSRTSAIGDLAPGRTAEVFVWVPVRRELTVCTNPGQGSGPGSVGSGTETLDFVVQAKGRATGALGRAGIHTEARDAGERNGVYLEGVVRQAGYGPTSPFVDIANASSRTIVGSVEPGKNITYYVRMTNTATWGEYVNSDDERREPDLKISLSDIKRAEGWNVSIRPVLDQGLNDILRNPYAAQYNLSNVNPTTTPPRREAWFDRELEVVVQAPSVENGTALAGLRHEFQIIANTNTTPDLSTLGIATIIADLANVTVRPDTPRIFAHPGESGAVQILISNNGSSAADVQLRASMNPDTTANAASWQVNPAAQRFPLPAFKNRTIALLVTPPPGSTQGTTGDVNLTIEYARNPFFPNVTTNVTLRLAAEVVAPGTLALTPAGGTDAIIGPGGTANFTMSLRNTGSLDLPFRLAATPIPNWTVTASPDQGTLRPGENRTVVLVLIAPSDVTNDTRFASVVKVEELNNANNFDTLAYGVNILGGKAIPRLSAPLRVKHVERNGLQQFEVQVQNVGSAAGRIPLEVRSADPSWQVGIIDQRGNPITGVQLGTNELVNINVTVRAPFTVPERTVTPVELTAFAPDVSVSAKETLSAEIHDYGVELTLLPPTRDALPGLPVEFHIRLRNTGNDNDTLNVSVNLIDLPEWSVQFSQEEVRLEPNQEQEVRATIRSPTGPLPAPRAYTFPFWVGTRGGQEVNITKNMTQPAVVTVPNYRAYDVDRDGQLEIAVDLDKRGGNGFEEFRDIFNEGLATQVVSRGLFEGRTTFFLDVPQDRPYDGVADIWFNPETVYAYTIPSAPDVNGDGTPDYFLDVDRDGKVDKVYDSATERFWDAIEVKVFGDERIQYVVDISGDGRPDRFFDPESGKVTRTQRADSVGAEYVGIDVDDDDRVDYYYNTRTKDTSAAEVSNVGSFARDYWWFFIAFAALVLLTVLLLVRRMRKRG